MDTRKERTIRETTKAAALRAMVDGKWTLADLQYIFGMVFRAKLEDQSNPHNSIGKHYFGSHDNTRQHPAGTKLVRSFIRRSGRESTVWRNLYKDLTGKHYGAAPTSP